jgi:hypothetical protein
MHSSIFFLLSSELHGHLFGADKGDVQGARTAVARMPAELHCWAAMLNPPEIGAISLV